MGTSVKMNSGHQKNNGDGEDEESPKNIIEHIVETMLESVFVGIIFKMHREVTINKLIGLCELSDKEEATEVQSEKRQTTIADSLRNKTIECKCFVCNRMIAAVRFAPHLEKCIGIGRNSRTRRRANNATDLVIQDQVGYTQRTTRSSTLRSAAKYTTSSSANINTTPNFEAFATQHPLVGNQHVASIQYDRYQEKDREAADEDSMRDRLRNKQQPIITANVNRINPLRILMKAIIQRVASASVIVDEKIISSIGRGICVLIGIGQDDADEDIEYIVRKLLNLRLFDNQETGRRWDKSVKELNLEVLSVSQFTLHASIKGNKLDFHRSMGPEDAPKFYAKYMDKLKKEYQQPERIKDGLFGAMMTVQITNEGPVTIKLDSKKRDD